MTVNSMDKESASDIIDLMTEFDGRFDQSVKWLRKTALTTNLLSIEVHWQI